MQGGASHRIGVVGVRVPLQEPVEHVIILIRGCKVQGCHPKRVQGFVHWEIRLHYCVNVPNFIVHNSLPQKLLSLIELIHHGIRAVLYHIFNYY